MVKKFNSSHAKYSTRNPISRYLLSRFLHEVKELTSGLDFEKVLDVGCGEGHVLNYLFNEGHGESYYAIDSDESEVEKARKNNSFCQCNLGSVYEIPFPDNFSDLVINTEVLEHLEQPGNAIKELYRVTKRYLIISVPNEPLWRILNMIRFHYIGNFGNTPGHINHWNRKSFVRLLTDKFNIIEIRGPIPWILLLCEKR